MQTAEELKQKCEELERLEDKYIKNLQTTRMKTNSFIENMLANKIALSNVNNSQMNNDFVMNGSCNVQKKNQIKVRHIKHKSMGNYSTNAKDDNLLIDVDNGKKSCSPFKP